MSLQEKLKTRRLSQSNLPLEGLPEELTDGQKLFCRRPTLADRDWIQDAGNPETCMLASCRMVVRCVVGSDGARVFSDMDAELVLHTEADPSDVSDIGAAIGTALKAAAVDLEGAVKN